MVYEDGKQLIREYKKLLIDCGMTQQEIADAIGLSRQGLYMFTTKKHISFDDMARLLAPAGYKLSFEFVKEGERE